MVCCRCSFPGQHLGPSLKHLFHRLQSPTQVPVLWRVFGWSRQAEHGCLLLIAASLRVSGAEAGLRPCPSCLLGLKAQGQGFPLVTLKVLVGGVPFQSSLQPPVRSLPHHCYCSSISEEQPLPGAGVPSSAGTSGVDPLEKRSPRVEPLLAHGHLPRAA